MAMLNNHRVDHLLHGWLSPRQAMSPSDQGAGHWEVGHPFFRRGKSLERVEKIMENMSNSWVCNL